MYYLGFLKILTSLCSVTYRNPASIRRRHHSTLFDILVTYSWASKLIRCVWISFELTVLWPKNSLTCKMPLHYAITSLSIVMFNARITAHFVPTEVL